MFIITARNLFGSNYDTVIVINNDYPACCIDMVTVIIFGQQCIRYTHSFLGGVGNIDTNIIIIGLDDLFTHSFFRGDSSINDIMEIS